MLCIFSALRYHTWPHVSEFREGSEGLALEHTFAGIVEVGVDVRKELQLLARQDQLLNRGKLLVHC